MATPVYLKKMTWTMEEGLIAKWLKHEGDTIQQGDPLVELETEKISYELESPAEGTLLKVLAQETAEVPVGDPLCHIGQLNDPVPES